VHVAATTAGRAQAWPGVAYSPVANGPNLPIARLASVATASYLAAFAAFAVIVYAALANPTAPSTAGSGVEIPADARCLRATRSADHARAWLPIGSPTRNAELLLRLDRVVDDPLDALRVRSTIVAQSLSKVCNVTSSRCSDVVQIGGRTTESVRNELTEFAVFSGVADASLAGYFLGLEGELSLVAGFRYWLTTSHFCWSNSTLPLPTTATAATVDVVAGSLMVSTSEGLGPVGCNNQTRASLFPAWAGVESQWLGLSSRYLYEHAENALDLRRAVVERAGVCGEDGANNAYWSDCAHSMAGCQPTASVPYRRLGSMHELFLSMDADGAGGWMVHQRAEELERVPALMSTDAATFVAILRLVLMVMVAGITYIRSSQTGTKSAQLVLAAWRYFHGLRPLRSCLNTDFEVWTTALTGTLALAARVVVVVAMGNVLLKDGQWVLLTSEILGCIVSGVHLLSRQLPIIQLDRERETPLTLYGGSMSLVDVTCSMLTVFAETPLLGTRQSFAAVGRMLAAVLLSINCINISVFAVVACAITASADLGPKPTLWQEVYRSLHVLGGLLWLVQTGCVAATFCGAFVQPFSWSLVRAHAGPWTMTRFAIATGFVAASVPVQNRALLAVVQTMARGGSARKQD
jgi:hypothetical protein